MSTPLHTWEPMRQTWLNRIFAFIYMLAILSLFYHHCLNLIHSPTLISIFLILADFTLAFMWLTNQAFRLNPVNRSVFIENLSQVAMESEYPALDVFICTADPYREPPMGVVNTALSVLAYDYPVDKLSVYVSDDGGSQLTLFAFMEAAKFAKHWLPYCKKNNIVDRCPQVYFSSNSTSYQQTVEIKVMYQSMRTRVEHVVARGSICPDYINDQNSSQAFRKWTHKFTRHNHPSVIQVLLENCSDKDIAGDAMPNLIYVSREKIKEIPHNFKAGALNVLLRVSATMTNAPIFLVLDCDMYSNDPKTPLRSLCYFLDPKMDPELGLVQFPQRFHNIKNNDIYGSELKFETQLNPAGMDGLSCLFFLGSGGFFRRRMMYGGSLSDVPSEFQQLSPAKVVGTPIQSEDVLALAHNVAGCNSEDNVNWGYKMGFRYGSLVEDFFTSYRLNCEGWKSILCNPKRAAFLGNFPMTLHDILTQTKRWSMGLIDVGLSKYNPIIFGVQFMNPLQVLCYAHYAFWPIWSIPVIVYAFLPQLALINSFSIFPKVRNTILIDTSYKRACEIGNKCIVVRIQVSDPWFCLYAFLFMGAYGKDSLDFILLGEGQVERWWNNQRMWMLRSISSFPFALIESLLRAVGMSKFEFGLTSKVVDDDLSKRYAQGLFEFSVDSSLFLPISVASTINLLSFFCGILQCCKTSGRLEELFLQIFLAGFVVVNSLPVYEAMILRSDRGKMPLKITLKSIALSLFLYLASSLAF